MADEHVAKKINGDKPEYPHKLENAEKRLLRIRREGLKQKDGAQLSFMFKHGDSLEHMVGIGLSGGGIRSATFCLGFFQGLAKKRLLSNIDYLSTVSGGGYFGAFYGRLFTRDAITNTSDVEDILAVRAVNHEESGNGSSACPRGRVFRWLRENGRYLAPSGSGDVLLAAAAMLRNFVAVHVVLWTFILMIFLGAQLIRGIIEVPFVCQVPEAPEDGQCSWWTALQTFLIDHLPGGKELIWWSPYTGLAGVLFLVLVVPPAWCYWLVEKPNRRNAGNWIAPFWGWFVVVLLSRFGMPAGWLLGNSVVFWVSCVVLVVAIETMIWGLISGYVPRFGSQKSEPNEKLIFDDERVRFRLSMQLRTALLVTGIVLAFAVIDSIAQTLYGAALSDQFRPRLWIPAIFGPLIALAGLGRTIASASPTKSKDKRFRVPVKLLAGAAAFVIAVLLLITIDAVSYAIAWQNKMPLGPRPDWTIAQPLNEAKRIEITPIPISEPQPPLCGNHESRLKKTSPTEGWRVMAEEATAAGFVCGTRKWKDVGLIASALIITFAFSFLFGWSWPFLNRSGHQSIYTSRLIRAYLGASNPGRLKEGGTVTQPIINDDINQDEYWPRFKLLQRYAVTDPEGAEAFKIIRAAERKLLKKRMPLHLVNVTINETLDPRSNIEQRDRKGTSMAIGPAGISVGVLHHLFLDLGHRQNPIKVYPPASPTAQTYRVFRYDQSAREFGGDAGLIATIRRFWSRRTRTRSTRLSSAEFLTLGNWTGVSGAAFSTSLGWRTSLPLSLLAGLANVRLTYWWNSGVQPMPSQPHENKFRHALSTFLECLFSVQTSFFHELFARYRGTARQWWPLSDGGHFENLGGYELIRRRLPVIIIIDAEADPDYTFQGLSNLIRKARLDFGAEIEFLSEDELDNSLDFEIRDQFGTLEQLRRDVRSDQPVRSIASGGLSQAHAALAKITHADGATSKLLYIKPTLVGDEPTDIERYHSEHPSFPHESTLQQFFDEAQWESYRKLGEHIASKVFRESTLRILGLQVFT